MDAFLGNLPQGYTAEFRGSSAGYNLVYWKQDLERCMRLRDKGEKIANVMLTAASSVSGTPEANAFTSKLDSLRELACPASWMHILTGFRLSLYTSNRSPILSAVCKTLCNPLWSAIHTDRKPDGTAPALAHHLYERTRRRNCWLNWCRKSRCKQKTVSSCSFRPLQNSTVRC